MAGTTSRWRSAGRRTLDGARGRFTEVNAAVRRDNPRAEEWEQIQYRVFDAPVIPGPVETRWAAATHAGAQVVESWRCEGRDHLRSELTRVVSEGGEGLMLRKPGSQHRDGRSFDVMKVKEHYKAFMEAK